MAEGRRGDVPAAWPAGGLSDLFKFLSEITGMIMMLLPAGVTVTVRVTAGRDYY